jgi:hypothetical protein
MILDGDLFLNDSGLTISADNKKALDVYVWYYLLNNKDAIFNCVRGTAQGNLDMEMFKDIMIPTVDISLQQSLMPEFKQVSLMKDSIRKWQEESHLLLAKLSNDAMKEEVTESEETKPKKKSSKKIINEDTTEENIEENIKITLKKEKKKADTDAKKDRKAGKKHLVV